MQESKRKIRPVFVLIGALAIVGLVGMLALGPKNAALVASETSGYGITMANYLRLQTGMTYPQVCEILGKDGTELARNEIAGYETLLYEWRGSGLAGMNVMFQNGKLIQKVQFGLK